MRIVLTAALVLAASGAFAADPAYLDDRSTADSLVRSLYNAVTRKEYARAWAYFGDAKPSADFDAFREGYADTDEVEVVTGDVSEEGAAGSVFYQVPVAIRAVAGDGSESVFAGCYTARLANPQLQEPPFTSLQLEKGNLKLANGALEQALPAGCGDGPPAAPATPGKARADAMFRATYDKQCDTLGRNAMPDAAVPEITEVRHRYSDAPESEPDRVGYLFRFSCFTGPYNTSEVYYFGDAYGEVEQIRFAEPDMDIRYVDTESAELDSMSIIGWTATDQLVNSFYDEKEQSLTSWVKWRGVGDQSSSAKYILRNGEFVLVHYEVDPTADEEINPEVVLDFDTGP
ncbi:MAG: DUF1176 domain-containing protein [Rhizobiaceae bacterium]|nr:DUF1176 domain-containing protein [Rhizobiaceae bacterium]